MMGGRKLRGGTERWTANNLLNSKRRPVHMLHFDNRPCHHWGGTVYYKAIVSSELRYGEAKKWIVWKLSIRLILRFAFWSFPNQKHKMHKIRTVAYCVIDIILVDLSPQSNHQRFMSCKGRLWQNTKENISTHTQPGPSLSKPWHSKISQRYLI